MRGKGAEALHMINTLDAFSQRMSRWLAALAGLFLVAMMLLACANMVLRAFKMPVQGTFELMGFLGAVATAFSLAYAQTNKAHISVGLLMKHFPRKVRAAMDAGMSLISCAFFVLAGAETGKWAAFLVNTGELSETLRIIYHPFVFATALGCLAMAFVLFVDFLKTITGKTEH